MPGPRQFGPRQSRVHYDPPDPTLATLAESVDDIPDAGRDAVYAPLRLDRITLRPFNDRVLGRLLQLLQERAIFAQI